MPDTTDTATASPGFNLADVVQKLQDQAAQEMGAAQQQAAQIRARADSPSVLSRIFRSPEQQLAQRQQLMQESQIPVAEVVQRHVARENALKEGMQAADVYGADIKTRLALEKLKPSGPMVDYLRAEAGKKGIQIPDGMSPAFLEIVDPQFKSMVESYAKGQEGAKAGAEATRIAATTPADIKKAEAEAAKTGAEAASTRALIEPTVAEKQAGAAKTGAEAAKIRLETGGQIAPGWVAGGEIGIGDKQREDFRTAFESDKNIHDAVDEIQALTGSHDFVANPTKRAAIQPRVAELLAHLKSNLQMRQLAGPELKFLESLSADPTAITPSNLTGLARNGVRLESYKDISTRDLENKAKTNGIKRLAPESGATSKAGAGSGRVYVWDAKGNRHSVPEAQAKQAIAQGYSLRKP